MRKKLCINILISVLAALCLASCSLLPVITQSPTAVTEPPKPTPTSTAIQAKPTLALTEKSTVQPTATELGTASPTPSPSPTPTEQAFDLKVVEKKITLKNDTVEVDVSLPDFTTSNTALKDFLKKSITEPLESEYNARYDELSKNKTQYGPNQCHVEFSVISLDENYLQINGKKEYYTSDSNGDQTQNFTYVVDIKNLKLMTVTDLFVDKNKASAAVLDLANNIIAQTVPDAMDRLTGITNDRFVWFLFSKDGIALIIDPYQVAPGADGTIAVFCPFGDIGMALKVSEEKLPDVNLHHLN